MLQIYAENSEVHLFLMIIIIMIVSLHFIGSLAVITLLLFPRSSITISANGNFKNILPTIYQLNERTYTKLYEFSIRLG